MQNYIYSCAQFNNFVIIILFNKIIIFIYKKRCQSAGTMCTLTSYQPVQLCYRKLFKIYFLLSQVSSDYVIVFYSSIN